MVYLYKENAIVLENAPVKLGRSNQSTITNLTILWPLLAHFRTDCAYSRYQSTYLSRRSYFTDVCENLYCNWTTPRVIQNEMGFEWRQSVEVRSKHPYHLMESFLNSDGLLVSINVPFSNIRVCTSKNLSMNPSLSLSRHLDVGMHKMWIFNINIIVLKRSHHFCL